MTEQEALNTACNELNIVPPSITDIDKFRWTLLTSEETFYKYMLKLERRLQELTNKRIDLRLETKEDKNRRVERTGR